MSSSLDSMKVFVATIGPLGGFGAVGALVYIIYKRLLKDITELWSKYSMIQAEIAEVKKEALTEDKVRQILNDKIDPTIQSYNKMSKTIDKILETVMDVKEKTAILEDRDERR